MKDQFNGKTEERHSPLNFTGHKVYEIVRMSMLSLLSKKKMTGMNIEEDDM
jgi:hypothetical protein